MGTDTSPHDSHVDILSALRDFFMARDEGELRAAYADFLAQPGHASPSPLPETIDWEQTIFGFNRLFVGPKALPAPPFASVWLEPEPRLMGASTMEARHVYELLGLSAPLRNKLPDDHISLELDALQLLEGAGSVQDTEVRAGLEGIRRYFLKHHVLRWMPRFCEAVLSCPETPEAVSVAAATLQHWLEHTRAALDALSGTGPLEEAFPAPSATPEVRP